MLILHRKAGDKIRIGENIVLTVKEVRGGRVRLEIEAPPEVSIFRSEMLPIDPDRAPQPRSK